MSVSLRVVRDPFRALCVAFVPESAELGESGWRELESEIELALADRPPAIQKQMVLWFTRGVLKTNFRRLPWSARLRFVARALGRRLSGGGRAGLF